MQELLQFLQIQLQQMLAAGMNPSQVEVREMLLQLKDKAYRQLGDIADEAAERMEKKMHQQMIEGQWTTEIGRSHV